MGGPVLPDSGSCIRWLPFRFKDLGLDVTLSVTLRGCALHSLWSAGGHGGKPSLGVFVLPLQIFVANHPGPLQDPLWKPSGPQAGNRQCPGRPPLHVRLSVPLRISLRLSTGDILCGVISVVVVSIGIILMDPDDLPADYLQAIIRNS